MKYHPDVNHDADAEEKFKELSEAYGYYQMMKKTKI